MLFLSNSESSGPSSCQDRLGDNIFEKLLMLNQYEWHCCDI